MNRGGQSREGDARSLRLVLVFVAMMVAVKERIKSNNQTRRGKPRENALFLVPISSHSVTLTFFF